MKKRSKHLMRKTKKKRMKTFVMLMKMQKLELWG